MPKEILETKTPSFYVKDCAIASIATGMKAQTLTELRDHLKTIPAESIYYHFWRQSMETSAAPDSFYNDFSYWAHYHLHDDILAERIALIDPTNYMDLEKLRFDIIEVIESRVDEHDSDRIWLRTSQAFHFIKSKIVVFNTPHTMEHPKDLVKTVPALSPSSVFYHFIDARRRQSMALDDFSFWLRDYGEEFALLIGRLNQIDPYFIPLIDLQQKLSNEITEFFLKDFIPAKGLNAERDSKFGFSDKEVS